ncbi:hypothetical protein C9I50_18175 [Pseudomonas prosekii]|nr:hypothetical protein C9I50_18175 [Pseudomonas prosekii]
MASSAADWCFRMASRCSSTKSVMQVLYSSTSVSN